MKSADGAPWKNLCAASLSYFIWGLFPLFWKQLQAVDATELIAHRVIWALLFLLVVVAQRGEFPQLCSGLSTFRETGRTFLSASLLTGNWLMYIWGVNHGHVIECSLGYFLVPLCNVLIGKFFLSERLRAAQWVAVVCAAAGVTLLVWHVHGVPWIALTIAGTFTLYGYLRKRAQLASLLGLTAETLLLFPFALGILFWKWRADRLAFGSTDARTTLLILSSGIITAIPLLLFAQGARGLRMVTLGLLQYITPTCQFLLGYLIYREAFSAERATAFIFIWVGLAIYTFDAGLAHRKENSLSVVLSDERDSRSQPIRPRA